MKENFELNYVKEAIIEITKLKGLSINEAQEFLDSDYQNNWDDELYDCCYKIVGYIKLFNFAMKENDISAQKIFLIRAEFYSHKLYNFFKNISDDFKKIAFSENFDFPTLPEGYKVPEKYSHKNSD